MKFHNLIVLLGAALVLSSCFGTKTVTKYAGTQYDHYKGVAENDILRTVGVPQRQMSDGANGKVLVYEQIAYVTNSQTSAKGNTYGAYNYWQDRPEIRSSANSNTQSVSTEKRKYVHFFIGANGYCYDVKTSPEYYKYQAAGTVKCFKKSSYWWALMPPYLLQLAIVGIVDAATDCPYCE